ncbi:hypothetical protein E2C01_083241 [Portunus trituberculatus]|uniref:Uncharacterized protein n=1 Tax=Portunus trituberculatus TaxID=210409 RepID=A0A5B7IUL6_PORTR|nr:hypothetical protein [Portunus trituberculatus]
MSLLTSVVVVVVVVVLAEAQAKESMAVGPLGASSRGVALQDDLLTPEWLQNIPAESKIAKYRKRRFINFPTGSKLEVRALAFLILLLLLLLLCNKGKMWSGVT